MQFFVERMISESTLVALGMDKPEDRTELLDLFDGCVRFVSKDRVSLLSIFLQSVTDCVLRTGTLQTSEMEWEGYRERLCESLKISETSVVDLREQNEAMLIQSDQLRIVNGQQLKGIEAFKTKVDGLKDRSKKMNVEKDELRVVVASLETKLQEAEGLCEDLRLANFFLDQQLVSAEKSKKSHSARYLQEARRQIAQHKTSIAKLKNDWNKWFKHGLSIQGGRTCGCYKSIAHFKKTGIDLEWIQAEAERASRGFQRELKETADSFRMQVADKLKELDIAVADNGVYIEQNLKAQDEIKQLRHAHTSVSSELSVVRSELFACKEIERVVRSTFLTNANGREKVCPVPTIDGDLIPLEHVYRGWMHSNGGVGREFQFQCPDSGEAWFILAPCSFVTHIVAGIWTSLAPVGVIRVVYSIIGAFGVSVKLPFKFQFFSISSQWIDFPFVDQLEIASRVCSLFAPSRTDDDNIQFPVLGADAVFEIRVLDSQVTSLKIICVRASDAESRHRGVRIVDVGDFFVGQQHLQFAEAIVA
jgi:hypothetical protein